MAPLNECSGCSRDFSSLRAFDTHRVGEFPQNGPSEYRGDIEHWTPELGRRCLTIEEMTQAEPPRRFVQDARGRWNLAHLQGRARQAFETVAA